MSNLIVHFLGHGMSACMREGPPSKWPENHKWSGDWKDVTCDECLLGRDEIKTYTLSADGKSITCLRCKRTSHSAKDVEHHYCGACHVSHDDLWPPARRWWINSYNQTPTMNQDTEALKQFKARMTSIARKNGDAFKTTVTFDERGYHVEVVETADDHTFLSGSGPTVVEAINTTLAKLPDALNDWGYDDAG